MPDQIAIRTLIKENVDKLCSQADANSKIALEIEMLLNTDLKVQRELEEVSAEFLAEVDKAMERRRRDSREWLRLLWLLPRCVMLRRRSCGRLVRLVLKVKIVEKLLVERLW